MSVRTDKWSFDPRVNEVHDASGAFVCAPRNPEDGALICAAPELLKAARRALSVLRAQGHSWRRGNVLESLVTAIDKAESRT